MKMNDARMYLGKISVLNGIEVEPTKRPKSICMRTTHTKHMGNKYFHSFPQYLIASSCLYSYEVIIISNIKTQIRIYDKFEENLYRLTEKALQFKKNGKMSIKSPHITDYKKGICSEVWSAIVNNLNFKEIVMVTKDDCILNVIIRPVSYKENIPFEYSLIEQEGHYIISPIITNDIGQLFFDALLLKYQRQSLNYILSNPVVKDEQVDIKNIQYFLNFTTVVSSTYNVNEDYRYPPFSVKVGNGTTGSAELSYNIRMKTSAGSSADVKISCIESLSRDSYSILKDATGKELTASHTGELAVGSFMLPKGIIDIGIHIYTPYGFSGDIGDNPATDLVQFDKFSLRIY
jgi:hypothetical protein